MSNEGTDRMERPIGAASNFAVPSLLPRSGPTVIDASQISFGFVILASPQSPMLLRAPRALRSQ